jgi:hypothetical protein
MSEVLANSIVIIAIVVSLGYAVWRLGPRKWRDALRARFNLKASTGDGCDACSGCAPTTNNEPATSKGARSLLAQIDALILRTSVLAEAAALPGAG